MTLNLNVLDTPSNDSIEQIPVLRRPTLASNPSCVHSLAESAQKRLKVPSIGCCWNAPQLTNWRQAWANRE